MPDPRRLSAVLGIALCLAAGAASEPIPEPPPVAALIAQLASPQFDEREAATRALIGVGTAALPRLRAALQSGDAETRRRARLLVQQLERRAEADRLLRPTRVRLAYRDTPLLQAVADLSRRIGIPVLLDGSRAKYLDRHITLETGDVCLWEALDQFCLKAELVHPLVTTGAWMDERFSYNPDERAAYPHGDYRASSRQENILTLKDGPAQELPIHVVGALRLRALPHGLLVARTARTAEVVVGLELTLERRLRLRNVVALRIEKAVDDHGQVLAQPVTTIAGARSLEESAPEEVAIPWDGASELPIESRSSAAAIAIRLHKGGKASERLRELRGTVALQVQRAPEALVTVDDVLKATGRPVEGPDGQSVRLVEADQAEDGRVSLRVEVTPARDLIVRGVPARLIHQLEHQRGRGMPVPPPVRPDQLTLLDTHGRAFTQASSSSPAVNGTGTAWGFTLEYRPAPNQGSPARLVYTGPRTFTIEVPFVLRDVPLS
jgi:hypothetical protein